MIKKEKEKEKSREEIFVSKQQKNKQKNCQLNRDQGLESRKMSIR